MRFLVDASVSPRVAALLAAAGHDAIAVRDVGLATARDEDILDWASTGDRVIVSHETDFGTLLAARRQVITFARSRLRVRRLPPWVAHVACLDVATTCHASGGQREQHGTMPR